jgi:hypothetical protein
MLDYLPFILIIISLSTLFTMKMFYKPNTNKSFDLSSLMPSFMNKVKS